MSANQETFNVGDRVRKNIDWEQLFGEVKEVLPDKEYSVVVYWPGIGQFAYKPSELTTRRPNYG